MAYSYCSIPYWIIDQLPSSGLQSLGKVEIIRHAAETPETRPDHDIIQEPLLVEREVAPRRDLTRNRVRHRRILLLCNVQAHAQLAGDGSHRAPGVGGVEEVPVRGVHGRQEAGQEGGLGRVGQGRLPDREGGGGDWRDVVWHARQDIGRLSRREGLAFDREWVVQEARIHRSAVGQCAVEQISIASTGTADGLRDAWCQQTSLCHSGVMM